MTPASSSREQVLTVGELARSFADRLQRDWPALWVRGEISGLKHHSSSGHRYFTIKDDEAQFSAVFWRGRASRSAVLPEDGMQVEAQVRLVFYGRGGRLQLDVQSMRPCGQGRLMLDYLELKNRLFQEGLFDPERKRPLPAFPQRIGLLTARDGAALQDLIRVITRRQPGIELFLQSTAVQGPGSGQELARNLRKLIGRAEELQLDLIILGRGGGSFEDLFGFNHEELIREIADCPLPVISAVGHEVDTSLSDLVADLRAATPSMAGELAVPDVREQLEYLGQLSSRMGQSMQEQLRSARRDLGALASHRALAEPVRRLRDAAQLLDQLSERLRRSLSAQSTGGERELADLKLRLRRALFRIQAEHAERISGWPERLERLLGNSLKRNREELARKGKGLERNMHFLLGIWRSRLEGLELKLRQQDLGRIEQAAFGMGMARVARKGRQIGTARELRVNDTIELTFQDGARQARVLEEGQGEQESP